MSAPSSKNHIDYTTHRGVRHTKSGKWGATIQHPLTKISVWLGSYNTPKAAADAYVKKKLEFDSMIADAATVQEAKKSLTKKSSDSKFMGQVEMNCKQSKVHGTQTVKAASVETRSLGNTDYSTYRGVRYTQSGKWGAAIRHPITMVSVWLGSFNDPKEAADAYIKKKLEFDSLVTKAAIEKDAKALARKRCKAKVMDEADISCKESNVLVVETIKTPSMETRSHYNADNANQLRRLPDSDSNKAGRRQGEISTRQAEVCLGTYTTREGAEAALHKRKQDLDSTSHHDDAVAKELNSECISKRTKNQKKALSESMDGLLTCNRICGVFQSESGRWFADIKNPMTKVRHFVGTYATAEEALEALNSKKHEYAEMMRKQSDAKIELVSKCQDAGSDARISKVEVTDMDDEYGGSQSNTDSLQVPSSSFVSDEEFDTSSSVINSCGELVGEFSRLDDELWIGCPLDDADDTILC